MAESFAPLSQFHLNRARNISIWSEHNQFCKLKRQFVLITVIVFYEFRQKTNFEQKRIETGIEVKMFRCKLPSIIISAIILTIAVQHGLYEIMINKYMIFKCGIFCI